MLGTGPFEAEGTSLSTDPENQRLAQTLTDDENLTVQLGCTGVSQVTSGNAKNQIVGVQWVYGRTCTRKK